MSIIQDLILNEYRRQQSSIELIASENYQSRNILTVQSSCFANKYAEWYPGKRYYGWQEYTDQLEQYTIDQAKALFHSDHANVQALSWAAANIAIFNAYCEPWDTILWMNLSHGWHLTHWSPVTMMSHIFNFVWYETMPDWSINYEQLRILAHTHRPKILLAWFSAYPRQLDYKLFVDIAREVDAIAFADMSHIGWLIAGWVVPNPLEAGFDIMMTTTHKSLRWPRWALILSMGQVSNPLKSVPKTREHLPTLIDRSVFPWVQWWPHMNTIAAIGIALEEASLPEFRSYAQSIITNAQALANELSILGYKLITWGTDNHLIVIDMIASKWIDGHTAQHILDSVCISTSKSPIPNDTLPPFRPSWLRLWTPAMTTRWVWLEGMKTIAIFIDKALSYHHNEDIMNHLKEEVSIFAETYRIP